jgi:signal transduction histidine kinase
MTWITIVWPMVAAACLTLGLIELRIGLSQPPRAARLLFSLCAIAVACVAALELAITRADSPIESEALLRWLNIGVGVIIASLTAFIWVFFGSGNKWLALAAPGLYAFALVFDFVPGSHVTYQEITGVRALEAFGGATYNVVEGVPSLWNGVAYLGVLVLLVFVADASVRLWRRGGRPRAAVVGGSVTFFVLTAGVHSALIESGIVRTPYLISWAYLAILVAMGYELTAEVLAAANLTRQQASEQRMGLASAAAGLGMWTWDDISARHRSELELQQLRSQLAHIGRVSMMGQLASALAHELSQPLGAILRNAEAAELFLQHDEPDLDELRAILADIRKDDQRAGDVIERLRAMLQRRSIEPRALAIGDLLGEVIALTRADAVARHVKLEMEAAPGLPTVMGDRVHLQQVLLNLVLNAVDAVDAAPAEHRRVAVRAHRGSERTVEVAVSDCGHGIAPEALGLLFEPFFTTKPNGMGIGLPISRTIIEAHGGRIWAENNAREGATFRFTLPVAEEASAS